MRIGFDAKRAFNNAAGLGNFSRNSITALASGFPDHEYFLFHHYDLLNLHYIINANSKQLFANYYRQQPRNIH